MPAKRSPAPARKKAAPFTARESEAEVEAFLRALKHPLKKEIEAVRLILLRVNPKISEGIKWNAPSFRTTEYFATMNLRAKDELQLVFHLGAKVRDVPAKGLQIADPKSLLKWLAKDRALVTLGAGVDIPANRKAFEAIVRAWLRYV